MSNVLLETAWHDAKNRRHKKEEAAHVRKPSFSRPASSLSVFLPVSGEPLYQNRFHTKIEESEASLLYSAAESSGMSSSEVGRFCVQEMLDRYSRINDLKAAVEKYKKAQADMHLSGGYEMTGYRPKYLADELTVRLSDEQASAFQELCDETGEKMSVLLRFAIYDTLRRYAVR